MTSTKHGKQMKIVKASDMVKTKTPVTTPSKTQTAKPKKSTKSKKAAKPRKAAKTKKKGKKATKKDITAAPANTVGRQLRLELKRALQSSPLGIFARAPPYQLQPHINMPRMKPDPTTLMT